MNDFVGQVPNYHCPRWQLCDWSRIHSSSLEHCHVSSSEAQGVHSQNAILPIRSLVQQLGQTHSYEISCCFRIVDGQYLAVYPLC